MLLSQFEITLLVLVQIRIFTFVDSPPVFGETTEVSWLSKEIKAAKLPQKKRLIELVIDGQGLVYKGSCLNCAAADSVEMEKILRKFPKFRMPATNRGLPVHYRMKFFVEG